MKKLFKVLLVLLAITTLLYGCLFSYMKIQGQDEPSPDDADLLLRISVIDKEQNAYYDLVEADKKLYWPEEQQERLTELSEGLNWDEAQVKEIISKNNETLTLFDRAVALPYYQDPAVTKIEDVSPDTVLTNVGNFRKISKVNLIKSQYLLRQGKDAVAADQALKSLHLGQMMQDSQSGMIPYLAGIAIKNSAVTTLGNMVQDTNLSPRVSVEMIKNMDSYQDNGDSLANGFRFDYAAAMSGLQSINDDTVTFLLEERPDLPSFIVLSSFYYKPNQTRRLFAERYRNLIQRSKTDCSQPVEKAQYFDADSQFAWASAYLTENIIGKILVDIVATSFDGVYKKKCETDAGISNLRIQLAAKAYRAEKKKEPASINDLVPAYLPAVPNDPFTAKPFVLTVAQ